MESWMLCSFLGSVFIRTLAIQHPCPAPRQHLHLNSRSVETFLRPRWPLLLLNRVRRKSGQQSCQKSSCPRNLGGSINQTPVISFEATRKVLCFDRVTSTLCLVLEGGKSKGKKKWPKERPFRWNNKDCNPFGLFLAASRKILSPKIFFALSSFISSFLFIFLSSFDFNSSFHSSFLSSSKQTGFSRGCAQ